SKAYGAFPLPRSCQPLPGSGIPTGPCSGFRAPVPDLCRGPGTPAFFSLRKTIPRHVMEAQGIRRQTENPPPQPPNLSPPETPVAGCCGHRLHTPCHHREGSTSPSLRPCAVSSAEPSPVRPAGRLPSRLASCQTSSLFDFL